MEKVVNEMLNEDEDNVAEEIKELRRTERAKMTNFWRKTTSRRKMKKTSR